VAVSESQVETDTVPEEEVEAWVVAETETLVEAEAEAGLWQRQRHWWRHRQGLWQRKRHWWRQGRGSLWRYYMK
jgi:hypothetical protein